MGFRLSPEAKPPHVRLTLSIKSQNRPLGSICSVFLPSELIPAHVGVSLARQPGCVSQSDGFLCPWVWVPARWWHSLAGVSSRPVPGSWVSLVPVVWGRQPRALTPVPAGTRRRSPCMTSHRGPWVSGPRDCGLRRRSGPVEPELLGAAQSPRVQPPPSPSPCPAPPPKRPPPGVTLWEAQRAPGRNDSP